MESDHALQSLFRHPEEIGRQVGFSDLAPLHGEWIRKMVFGEGDFTLQAHRGSYKSSCLAVAISLILVLFPGRNIIFLRKTDSDVSEMMGIQILKLIEEYPNPKWRALFYLALYCGIRPGEMIGLNWPDYDGINIFIQAGSYQKKGEKTKRTSKLKTKKSVRKIALTQEAISALDTWKTVQAEYSMKFGEHWPEPDAIFTNENGFRLRKDAPSKAWRRFTKKYGLRHLPLYDLRHTHCSLLIASRELSIEEIASRLGHEQTSTTLDIYSHAFASANERATEALINVLRKVASEQTPK